MDRKHFFRTTSKSSANSFLTIATNVRYTSMQRQSVRRFDRFVNIPCIWGWQYLSRMKVSNSHRHSGRRTNNTLNFVETSAPSKNSLLLPYILLLRRTESSEWNLELGPLRVTICSLTSIFSPWWLLTFISRLCSVTPAASVLAAPDESSYRTWMSRTLTSMFFRRFVTSFSVNVSGLSFLAFLLFFASSA